MLHQKVSGCPEATTSQSQAGRKDSPQLQEVRLTGKVYVKLAKGMIYGSIISNLLPLPVFLCCPNFVVSSVGKMRTLLGVGCSKQDCSFNLAFWPAELPLPLLTLYPFFGSSWQFTTFEWPVVMLNFLIFGILP